MPRHPFPTVRAGAVAAVLALSLAACSSTPDAPPPELPAARAAIEQAAPDVLNRYAAVEMREARERLTAAEAAWRDERYEEARRAAAESLATVRLARARADAAQAEEAREDVARTIQTLESEVGLTAPATAPPVSTSPAETQAPSSQAPSSAPSASTTPPAGGR